MSQYYYPLFEEPMDMQSDMQGSHYMNKQLVQTIHDCEANCEHMTHHVKMLPDFTSRMRQAALLRECADVCGLTAKTLARGAIDAKQMVELCAMVCKTCGMECGKFTDHMSRHCSKVCLACARECANFVNK